MADLGPGDMIPMSLMEMGVRERARVISIDPCPPIEAGPGHVVTAVLSSDGIDMKLAGLAEPIEVTGNHPIFSEDRRDFVTVTHLRDGERLRTRAGTIAVESVTAMPGVHRVYNMEVGEAHQYYVSERLVLVHNDNSNSDDDKNAGQKKLSDRAARQRWLNDKARIPRVIREMKARGYSSEDIARWGRQADQQAQFGNTSRDPDLGPLPPPWDPDYPG